MIKPIFVVNSFSKYFNMTGFRLGWVVAPEAYANDLDRLAQYLFLRLLDHRAVCGACSVLARNEGNA